MKTIALSLLSLLAIALPLAAGGCGGSHADRTADLIDTAVEAGSFDTLAAALEAADLVGVLRSDGPFTVFAPTDAAFAKLPAGTVEDLLRPENRDRLRAVLTYHVTPGELAAGELAGRSAIGTVNGQLIEIERRRQALRIDGAKVIETDIRASNGVIHVIDEVMLPSFDDLVGVAGSAGDFSTLLAAAKAAGLVGTLRGEGPLTLFAPTDAAFAALPEGTVSALLEPKNRDALRAVLTYHVVPGRISSEDARTALSAEAVSGDTLRFRQTRRGLQVNDARILAADVDATNGVIHTIDSVLLPSSLDLSSLLVPDGADELARR